MFKDGHFVGGDKKLKQWCDQAETLPAPNFRRLLFEKKRKQFINWWWGPLTYYDATSRDVDTMESDFVS